MNVENIIDLAELEKILWDKHIERGDDLVKSAEHLNELENELTKKEHEIDKRIIAGTKEMLSDELLEIEQRHKTIDKKEKELDKIIDRQVADKTQELCEIESTVETVLQSALEKEKIYKEKLASLENEIRKEAILRLTKGDINQPGLREQYKKARMGVDE